jgi:hypothetical protein
VRSDILKRDESCADTNNCSNAKVQTRNKYLYDFMTAFWTMVFYFHRREKRKMSFAEVFPDKIKAGYDS